MVKTNMTITTLNVSDRINNIIAKWGADDIGLPTRDSWKKLANCPDNQPITLVNFFKLRETASYPTGNTIDGAHSTSGAEAFQRYANVSAPSLEMVGGRFLLVAPFSNVFIGAAEDWDMVAIGSYPNPSALLSLFELDEYHAAYVHRIAACSDQKVLLCLG